MSDDPELETQRWWSGEEIPMLLEEHLAYVWKLKGGNHGHGLHFFDDTLEQQSGNFLFHEMSPADRKEHESLSIQKGIYHTFHC